MSDLLAQMSTQKIGIIIFCLLIIYPVYKIVSNLGELAEFGLVMIKREFARKRYDKFIFSPGIVGTLPLLFRREVKTATELRRLVNADEVTMLELSLDRNDARMLVDVTIGREIAYFKISFCSIQENLAVNRWILLSFVYPKRIARAIEFDDVFKSKYVLAFDEISPPGE